MKTFIIKSEAGWKLDAENKEKALEKWRDKMTEYSNRQIVNMVVEHTRADEVFPPEETIKIRFKDFEGWLLKDIIGWGRRPLAPYDDCDEDGRVNTLGVGWGIYDVEREEVLRFGEVVGTKEDIEVLKVGDNKQ